MRIRADQKLVSEQCGLSSCMTGVVELFVKETFYGLAVKLRLGESSRIFDVY